MGVVNSMKKTVTFSQIFQTVTYLPREFMRKSQFFCVAVGPVPIQNTMQSELFRFPFVKLFIDVYFKEIFNEAKVTPLPRRITNFHSILNQILIFQRVK